MTVKVKSQSPLTVASEDPEDTLRLGRALAESGLRASDVIALSGPLGAGKTVLVKGLAEGLGVQSGRAVTSPTFVLLNKHLGRIPLYHFDAYRLRSATDMFDIGCEEIFYGSGVSVVEWADHVRGCLPEDRLEIGIEITGPASRRVTLTPRGARWRRFVTALTKRLTR